MEEKKLVIFHKDTTYAGRLMNYCNREKESGFTAVTFAERELLEDYLRNNPSSVLLCEESASDISALQAICGRLFILSESVRGDNCAGVIFRYCPASQVLKKAGESKAFTADEKTIAGRIIGVISASDEGTGSEYAKNLAKKCAETEKVLFLGLSELFRPNGSDFGANAISELFYRLNREEELDISGLILRHEGFDCICGYSFWADSDELTAAGTEKLAAFLSSCDYDRVILDLCSLKSFTVPLLQCCDRIILKKTESRYEAGRLSEMKGQLAFAGLGDLISRMEEA